MPDHENAPSTNESIRHITEGLRTALRLTGISHRACERELGLSVGYLTRILAGQVQLRVSIVLDLCRMIGLPPAAFLTALFPDPQVSEPTDRILRGLAAVHRPHPSLRAEAVALGDAPPPPLSPAGPALRNQSVPSPVGLDEVLFQLRSAVGKLEAFAEPAAASGPKRPSPGPGPR